MSEGTMESLEVFTQPFPTLEGVRWSQFCDLGLSDPIPLRQADLAKPFVYERRFGLFYVPGGYHPGAMSFLLALQHDCDKGIQVAEKLGLKHTSGTADHWLQHTPGAAFRSSVGRCIQVGSAKGLSVLERRQFMPFVEVFGSAV